MRAALIAILFTGCGWSFTPPDHPVHDQEEGGALHARRFETPFLCGTAGDPEGAEPCPQTRPPDDRVSCDSVGCHGTYDFSEASALARDLIGSDGPSCYTCHGREWED